jgi:hypothetical protein
MKKILMAASAALCFSGGSFALDSADGVNAFKNALGGLNTPVIASGLIAAGIAAGIATNNRGIAKEIVVIDPIDPVDPVDPTCNGSDPLVDGVCTGTTTTVTVTGTGTMTVPVTFTYAPSV